MEEGRVDEGEDDRSRRSQTPSPEDPPQRESIDIYLTSRNHSARISIYRKSQQSPSSACNRQTLEQERTQRARHKTAVGIDGSAIVRGGSWPASQPARRRLSYEDPHIASSIL